jgi:predicted dehydrogenase
MYGVAIIGCGRIAPRHIEAINYSPDFDLIAVCDKNIKKAEKYAGREIFAYEEYKTMLEASNADIVCVLAEAGNHAKIVCDIAKYKKHIIVEKPMALRLEDADRMIKACYDNGIELFVVKQNRYNLPVMQLRRALEAGRFGKLTLGTIRLRWARHQKYYDMDAWRGTWALEGGVLASQASHHVDLLQWMMGPVDSVMIQPEDTAVVILEFKNGALGVIEATVATRPENLEGSISILGEGGTVVIEGFAVNKLKTWKFEQATDQDIDIMKYSENPPDVYGFGHSRFYEDVYTSLENNERPKIDGIEGKKSLELVNAIYQSAERGKKIFLNQETRMGK